MQLKKTLKQENRKCAKLDGRRIKTSRLVTIVIPIRVTGVAAMPATQRRSLGSRFKTVCAVVLLCMLISLAACSSAKDGNRAEPLEVRYFEYADWLESRVSQNRYTEVLPDAETALAYANLLWKRFYVDPVPELLSRADLSDSMKETILATSQYKAQAIALDPEKGVWQVSFWEEGTATLGGSREIYLSKVTGEVLGHVMSE